MRYLKQSTAATVAVGPFLDAADGVTPETAVSDPSADARLVKNGSGDAVALSSWAHDAAGVYLAGLSTSHTDTVGRLRLSFSSPAAYRPVVEDFTVLSASVYDSLFGTAALLTPSTSLAEGYAADGAAFTLEQALYMIWALLAERSISGTTLTAKKVDGSTTAMTFTLNSTTPTSQTRAS